MKKWLLEHFLPMWAKETVLRDNRAYRHEVSRLRQQVRELEAYCRGLELGLRAVHRRRRTKDNGQLTMDN